MSFLYNNVREMINYPIKLQLIFEETNRKKFYSKVDVRLRRRLLFMKKKSLWLLLALTAALLGACQSTKETTVAESQTQEASQESTQESEATKTGNSDEIIIGQTWVISNTDPTDSSVPWSLTSDGVSETVFMVDKDGKLYSRFIDSFEKVDDLTWKAVTKNEAKFSNGDLADAKAIADCMNLIQTKNQLSNATAGVVSFTATDDKTLEIKTERPLQRLDSLLTEWSNIVFKKLDDGSFVYTGPYVIKELKENIETSLTPNPEYPDADKRPNIKIMKFNDASALKLAFESGEIDMAFTITPEVAKMFESSGKIVKTIEAGYQYFGMFNLNSEIYKDYAVREAVNLGINREDYLKALSGGKIANGFFAHYYDFAGDVVLKTDVEKAKSLLDEAGWVLKDGVREKDGKKLTIKIVTYPSRPDLSVIMQVMTSQLKELGFEVSTEVVDGIDKAAKAGEFDLILYAQHTAPTADPSFALNQFFRTEGAKNFTGYSSEEMDKLLDELGSESDYAKRVELSKKAQELVAKDLPVLYLIDPQWHIAVSEKLANYQPYNGDYYIVNDQLMK